MDILRHRTFKTFSIIALTVLMTACASRGGYDPLPPVKVITETVEVEIYAPPLPPEIQLNDVEWKVITNTPCKPATGKKTLSEGKWYYTTERFEYEEYFDEEKQETRRRVKRDAEGNRISFNKTGPLNSLFAIEG